MCKRRSTPWLVLLCLMLVSASALAQSRGNLVSGYVVMVDGDTVRGFILDLNDKWSVDQIQLYREKGGPPAMVPIGKITTMYLADYDAYYFSQDVEYDVKPIATSRLEDEGSPRMVRETVLLQLLTAGPINLYDFSDRSGKRHFFVQKDRGPVKELSFVRYMAQNGRVAEMHLYRGQMRALTTDCGKMSGVVLPGLTERALIKHIETYNRCMGHEPVSRTKENSRLSVYIFGGAFAGRPGFSGSDAASLAPTPTVNGTYSPATAINAGNDLELVPGRQTNRSRPGIHLSYYQSTTSSTSDQTVTYSLQFETFNVGPSYRLNLGQNKLINPYIRTSIGAAYILNNDGLRESTMSSPRTFVTFKPFGYYAQFSIGAQIKFVTLEVRGHLIHEPSESAAAARLPAIGACLGFQLVK